MPKMFGCEDARPYAVEKDGRQLIEPIEKFGVKLLSIGFFVSPETATLWRGGMACSALKQLICDSDWSDIDYLILDTPPGTSDIHLSLLQILNITGAVIVSTPQQVALADARKGIDMYQNDKVNVPILGLVENMAYFTPAELPGEQILHLRQGRLQESCRATQPSAPCTNTYRAERLREWRQRYSCGNGCRLTYRPGVSRPCAGNCFQGTLIIIW